MKIAFCFDLDGTLTSEEILPQIARHLQLYEEIDLLTNITMQGLISFDKSFKLRVKLLSLVPISEVKKIVSKIKFDQSLSDFVKANKNDCYIVTGNLDVWVRDFIQENYGCEFYSSIADYSNDQLNGITKIITKADAVKELRQKYDMIVAVGDGMNDCSMFEQADKSIAYGGVHQPVTSLIKFSDYVVYESSALVTLLNSLKECSYENK